MENSFRDETKKSKKRKKAARATLSFALDDEDVEADSPKDVKGDSVNGDDTSEEPPVKRSKLKKNPNVDTSFLPDREREEAERKERERLRLEWLSMQEQTRNENIEITYSYWDGSGHRKSVSVSAFFPAPFFLNPPIHYLQCKKGDMIATFLEKCRLQFPELRGVSVDNLMYIKVVIVPTFCCLSLTDTASRRISSYLM